MKPNELEPLTEGVPVYSPLLTKSYEEPVKLKVSWLLPLFLASVLTGFVIGGLVL